MKTYVYKGGFMDFRYLTADEREALYNEVWSEPMTTVSKRYGMSDNGLRKHCKTLGIPMPSLGYWAKVQAGQTVPRTDLPKVTGEVRHHIRNYFIKFKTDIEKLTEAELLSDEEFSLLTEETKKSIKEICSQLQVKSQLRNPHHLITEHQAEILYRKKRDKALKQASFSSNWYAKVKSEYRDNKPVLPINVSESNINRTYRILDTIINTLEEMEGNTRVNELQYIDQRKDEAYFVVMYSSFYFEIKEDARKKLSSKNNGESQPCLVFLISPRGGYVNNEQAKLEYKDKDNEPLEAQVGKILFDMFIIANKRRGLEEIRRREEKRVWDEQKRKWRLEQMRNGQLEQVKLLEQSSSDWSKAEQIRRFADCLEGKINEVTNEEKREKLFRWLKWARDKADWLDPLTAKEDKLLGKSKHIFELIEHKDF
jgi:hypothetical protein